jgi:hypothetical protein
MAVGLLGGCCCVPWVRCSDHTVCGCVCVGSAVSALLPLPEPRDTKAVTHQERVLPGSVGEQTGQDTTPHHSGRQNGRRYWAAHHTTVQQDTEWEIESQHSTVQCTTGKEVEENTAQHSVAQDRIGQVRTGQGRAGQDWTGQCERPQHSTV